tara:strand:+ start:74 stop:430 length:357 start_codon:yes stop_codon:yes gene_type:complete
MKLLLTLVFLMFPFSTLAEVYSCQYNELGLSKIITFDRVTHSHFKICDSESCDKNRYEVMFADYKNLIFGNIIKEQTESESFQLVIIDKITNLFIVNKLSLPNSNINNEFVKGKCILN